MKAGPSVRTPLGVDMTEGEKHIKEIDADFILRTLDHIKVMKQERSSSGLWMERRWSLMGE